MDSSALLSASTGQNETAAWPDSILELSLDLVHSNPLPRSRFFQKTEIEKFTQSFEESQDFQPSQVFATTGEIGDFDPQGRGSGNLGLVLGLVFGLLFLVAIAVAAAFWVYRQHLAKEKKESVDDGDHMAEFYDRMQREKEDEMTVDFQNPMFTNAGLGGDSDAIE
jgi:hypothetical protein